MSQLNISTLTAYLRIFIVFFILIVCINNAHVSANGIDDEAFYLAESMPEGIELTRRSVWSRLFRSETNSPRKMNSHSSQLSPVSSFSIENGRLHLLPHDKRTIPIELRKALYAHGIVGRRR